MKLAYFSILASLGLAAMANGDPEVELGYAKYRGSVLQDLNLHSYRGIQFAQPPVGDLRFRAPQRIENGTHLGTIDAKSQGKMCLQFSPGYNDHPANTNSGEDCLLLDVLAPPDAQNLPVLVSIHGGGFVGGNADGPGGAGLVHRADGKLIYVSIQYRLGALGFLAGDEIAKNGTLNVGLLDQRMALEWVQDNIHKFGGDPKKVTIWGGSAGGVSVSMQMSAYGGEGTPPFRAAIPEFPGWHPNLPPQQQNEQYDLMLKSADCDSLACLRGLTEPEMLAAGQKTLDDGYPSKGYPYGLFWFNPVIDNKFVRGRQTTDFSKGAFHDIPVLTTHNQYEGYIFTPKDLNQTGETADAKFMFIHDTDEMIKRVYELYPRSQFNSTLFRRQQWYGDVIYSCPTRFIASAVEKRNKVWKMIFDAGSATHGATGAFLNSNDNKYSGANNQTLVDIMTSYWINFVTDLNPNSPHTPEWETYNENGGSNVMKVTYTTVSEKRDEEDSEQCDMWGKYAWTIPN